MNRGLNITVILLQTSSSVRSKAGNLKERNDMPPGKLTQNETAIV